MSCKRYSSASTSMLIRSDTDWAVPALIVIVLATLVWPPAGAVLVVLGAVLCLWKD